MKLIGPPVLTLIAIFGNALSFYILSRPKFIKVSMFRYFIYVFFMATLSLTLMWMQFIPLLLKWQPPVLYCKIFIYFVYIGYNFYPWIHVLNSFDRLLLVKYSKRFVKFHKTKYQLLAVSLVFFIFCFTSLPYALFETSSNQTVCTLTERSIGFYLSLQSLILSNFIPIFLMLLSTGLVIHYLIDQKKKLSLPSDQKKYKREKEFLKNVLVMDIWFIICYLPYSLLTFLTYADIFDERNILWDFIHDLSIILMIVETASNFFLLLIFNKLFRGYLKSMIATCLNKRKYLI